MPLPGMDIAIHDAAVLIEFGGSLVVVAGCLRAILVLARDRGSQGIVRARLLVADGVIAALGFKTAATLLKILELQTWTAILFFAAIVALRTLVKRVLSWEVRQLRNAEPSDATRDQTSPNQNLAADAARGVSCVSCDAPRSTDARFRATAP